MCSKIINVIQRNGWRIEYRQVTDDYFQVSQFNELHQLLWWYDSNGETERFEYHEIGKTKSGEIIWRCDTIHSTITLVWMRKQFTYDEASLIKEWVAPTLEYMKRLKLR